MARKRPLLPRQVWSIRVRLEMSGSARDLALFNLAIDSKLRASDLVRLKIADVDLRFQAREAGHVAILVPQAVVEREPRLGNSQLHARTVAIKVDATSRMAVLAHLIQNGANCLWELAGLVTHADPFGAVVHLVITGAIALNIDQCITPYTMVDIPAPAARSH